MPPPRHDPGEASYPLLSRFGLVYNIVPVGMLLQRYGGGVRGGVLFILYPILLVHAACLPSCSQERCW